MDKVRHALSDVSLEIERGEVFGLVGRNGAGKSTLLKVLAKIVAPTSGTAWIHGRVAALLEVGTGMHVEMTGRENVYLNGALLGLSRAEVHSRFGEIIEFAGIGDYVDTPIKRYSSGMHLRLAFAVAAHLTADVLVVDEVLAVGDAEFQERCLGVMRRGFASGRTTIYVSHNMASVEHLCHRAAWLDSGAVRAVGPTGEVVSAYLHATMRETGGGSRVFAEGEVRGEGVELAAISASGPSGGPVVQGSHLEVSLTVRLREARRGVILVVSLRTAEGVLVFTSWSSDHGVTWDLDPGPHVLRVRFPDARLLPRAHRLGVRVLMQDGRRRALLEHDDALSFTVQGSDVTGHGVAIASDRGTTWLPAEFSVDGGAST